MLKKIKSGLFKLALLGLFYGTGYVQLRSSQYHSDFIRSYVGSKVVKIINEEKNAGGTGFFVKANSGEVYLMTNAHVCGREGEKIVNVELPGNDRMVQLKIIEVSEVTDLCLVEAPKYIKSGLSIASDVNLGEEISIVGHPKLMPLTETKGQFIGYLDILMPLHLGPCESETATNQTYPTMFGAVCVQKMHVGATTVLALHGNSGSPTVNYKGQVVGVLFAGDDKDNWGVTIGLKDVKDFLSIY